MSDHNIRLWSDTSIVQPIYEDLLLFAAPNKYVKMKKKQCIQHMKKSLFFPREICSFSDILTAIATPLYP